MAASRSFLLIIVIAYSSGYRSFVLGIYFGRMFNRGCISSLHQKRQDSRYHE